MDAASTGPSDFNVPCVDVDRDDEAEAGFGNSSMRRHLADAEALVEEANKLSASAWQARGVQRQRPSAPRRRCSHPLPNNASSEMTSLAWGAGARDGCAYFTCARVGKLCRRGASWRWSCCPRSSSFFGSSLRSLPCFRAASWSVVRAMPTLPSVEALRGARATRTPRVTACSHATARAVVPRGGNACPARATAAATIRVPARASTSRAVQVPASRPWVK